MCTLPSNFIECRRSPQFLLGLGQFTLQRQNMAKRVSCFFVVRVERHGLLECHKRLLLILLQARDAFLVISF
jgi:hypothetical protein